MEPPLIAFTPDAEFPLKFAEKGVLQKDSFLVKSLMNVYREVTGDIKAQPQIDGGCTYARTMKNCVAFGALLPDQPDLMHQKNEYVEVEKLKIWMRIYLKAIERLAK